jgi:hypothetical protein
MDSTAIYHYFLLDTLFLCFISPPECVSPAQAVEMWG